VGPNLERCAPNKPNQKTRTLRGKVVSWGDRLALLEDSFEFRKGLRQCRATAFSAVRGWDFGATRGTDERIAVTMLDQTFEDEKRGYALVFDTTLEVANGMGPLSCRIDPFDTTTRIDG
jgi:hypothetical protein